MSAVAWRAEAGAIVAAPHEPGPLAADELLVEHLAFALGPSPGDSAVARVVAVGAELTAEAARWVGRVVALPALRACGGCVACRRGQPGLCPRLPPASPLASQGRVAARLAVPFADDAGPGSLPVPASPSLLAALSHTGLTAYAAVIRAGVEPNRAAIVLGRGPLARFVCAFVTHRGARALRAATPADRPRLDRELEAAGVEAFAVPLICVEGDAGGAVELAGPGATVVLCGSASATTLPASPVTSRGLTVHGLGGAHPDLLPELCAFVHKGALDLAGLCRTVDDREAAALLGAGRDDDPEERVALWRPARG